MASQASCLNLLSSWTYIKPCSNSFRFCRAGGSPESWPASISSLLPGLKFLSLCAALFSVAGLTQLSQTYFYVFHKFDTMRKQHLEYYSLIARYQSCYLCQQSSRVDFKAAVCAALLNSAVLVTVVQIPWVLRFSFACVQGFCLCYFGFCYPSWPQTSLSGWG